MPDDPFQDIAQEIAELLHPEWFGREELCTQLGIQQELLDACLEWEVIQPSHTNQKGEDLFTAETIHRLSRGLRLHRDLGVNWAGVVVALDLLERIEELERKFPHSSPL